jgi:sugar-specific transcriptional regulator TrmB
MQQILSNILGKDEAKTYLATLELGTPTISRLSKKTGIPRSTTYLIIDDLEESGLISRTTHKGKSKVIPADPETVKNILEKDIRNLKHLKTEFELKLPELRALQVKSHNKPKVQYFEGKENIRNLLLTIVEESKNSEYLNLCQGYTQKHAGLAQDPDYLKEAIRLVKKHQVSGKEILEDMKAAREHKKNMQNTNVEVQLAPPIKDKDTTHIDKYIWKEKVAFINSEIDYAVMIEDKFIAENERLSFNVLWNALKKDGYKY